MKDQDYYVESANPGKSWSLYTYKQPGRLPYANAIEGERSEGCFRTVIHLGQPGPNRRVMLPGGRMTAKAKAAALAQLEANLRAEGLLKGEGA